MTCRTGHVMWEGFIALAEQCAENLIEYDRECTAENEMSWLRASSRRHVWLHNLRVPDVRLISKPSSNTQERWEISKQKLFNAVFAGCGH